MSGGTTIDMTPNDIDETITGAGHTTRAEPVRMTTDVERMLAVIVDHQQSEISSLRSALRAVLLRLDMQQSLERLYPVEIEGLGQGARQARTSAIPVGLLRSMAQTGRSLAQVAGGREYAEELLGRIRDWRSSL